MKTPSLRVAMVILTLCLSTSLVWAQDGSDEGIGLFTAVQGAVTVTHPRAADTLPVNLHDEVLFKDVIQTRNESRTKAFFEDDSILTVGEKSRVEITEYIYDPDRNLRRTVVKLVQGRLRALVAKVFNGPGSAFEIHTPTAVAAARGTYFVVWVENGVTGIVNIGNSGRVDFTSEGKTVTVDPGEYSVAAASEPPAQPLVYNVDPNVGRVVTVEKAAVRIAAELLTTQINGTIENTLGKATETLGKTLGKVNSVVDQQVSILASARNAIEGTTLKDAPRPELARDAIRASQTSVLARPAASETTATPGMKSTPGPNGTPAGQATPVTSTAPIAPTVLATPTVTLAPVTAIVPVTPPAVISGAVSTLTKPLK